MSDAATISFVLTYVGTLAVAALMFIGQLTALAVLLVMAGTTRLITLPVRALIRRADN
ncbi:MULTISPECIES: hypothetical protein [unclassified Arthrobacter]|uniref:hypothetical protein n=1 Tax=unclassified Arthrobacter TaxID=235627 RepID=UPI0033971381